MPAVGEAAALASVHGAASLAATSVTPQGGDGVEDDGVEQPRAEASGDGGPGGIRGEVS